MSCTVCGHDHRATVALCGQCGHVHIPGETACPVPYMAKLVPLAPAYVDDGGCTVCAVSLTCPVHYPEASS